MRESADGSPAQPEALGLWVRAWPHEAGERGRAPLRDILRELRIRLARDTARHTLPAAALGHLVERGRALHDGLRPAALRRGQLDETA